MRGSINGSQGSCCPKGCPVGAPGWQLCRAAGAASCVKVPACAGPVQGHPRHTCACAFPNHLPCCTQLGLSCPSVPGLHCQMPGGAMRTLGGCDLQSDRGLQERGTAAGQTQLRFPPWFSVHLGNCVQEKAKGNQFLCMLFPLKIKM